MKSLLLAVLMLSLVVPFATNAAAGESLVDAAKAARAKRKQSTSKVITNADVKKTKGTIVQRRGTPAPADPLPEQTRTEKHNAERKAQAELEGKRALLQKDVAALEKELAALEQQYYEENDLDRRDSEIAAKFNVVKTKLDTARKALEVLSPATTP